MTPGTPHDPTRCKPVTELIALISEKWSLFIVHVLRLGPLRFGEIKTAASGISQRMLTLTLRHLERNGVVTRTVISKSPLHVDYALTPLGHSLIHPVDSLGDWAIANHDAMEQARRIYDAVHGAGV